MPVVNDEVISWFCVIAGSIPDCESKIIESAADAEGEPVSELEEEVDSGNAMDVNGDDDVGVGAEAGEDAETCNGCFWCHLGRV